MKELLDFIRKHKEKALLAKYNINVDDNTLNVIMSNSISDLEEMLSQLKFIDSKEIITKIIQISNLEIIQKYVSLMDVGIISKEILINNIDLFNANSLLYKNFINIMAMIKERKINPYLFYSCQEIYLIDINVLAHNLDVLESYSLFNLMKSQESYHFFADTDLCLSIDTLLELGFEKYLEEDLTLLNYSNKFDRLKVLKMLNMPITSKEELIDVLTDDKFFIPDSTIKEYIYSSENNQVTYEFGDNFEVEERFSLENCSGETQRTYIIGDVIVSKNKIYRIFQDESLKTLNKVIK